MVPMTEQSPEGTTAAAPRQSGPRVGQHEMHDVARLRRSATDRYIAGVAGGLGRHFDVDPTVIRVVLVVLSFFGGAGLLVYAAVWLLVPEDGHDRAPVDLSGEALKLALVGVAFVAVLIAFGTPFFAHGWGFGFPVPLLVAGLVAFGVYSLVRRRGHQAFAPAPPAPWGAAAPTSPPEGSAMSTTTAPLQTAGQPPAGQPPVGQPLSASPAWMPPPVPAYTPPPRPRRTGLVLFWPTLALVAIALGILGMVDVGHDVPVSAYAALGLTVVGVMLLVGAFVGRPGGLIALGLVGALGLGATSILDATTGGAVTNENVSLAPISAADVHPDYQYGTGTLRLDLTRVQDLAALGGRTVEVHLDAGELDVVVPRGLNVDVAASIRYAGQIDVGGTSGNGGWNQSLTRTLTTSTSPGAPTLDLHLDSRVGHIAVTTAP